MNKKIILGIVIIVALVLVGWNVLNPKYTKINREEVVKTDWKTYTNEKFGYSFQYPKNWSTKVLRGDPLGDSATIGFMDLTTNNQLMSVSNPIREIGYEFMIATGTPGSFLVKESVKAIKTASFVDGENPDMIYTHLTWGEDNWMKSGEIWFSLNTGDKDLENIVDTVLSTFKFTN